MRSSATSSKLCPFSASKALSPVVASYRRTMTSQIGGVIFDQTGSASRLLCSNQCRAGTTKRIEHDIAPTATVLDRIGNKSGRFDCWVKRELLHSPCSETVHPGVVPNVRPIAASVPKPKRVLVRGGSDLENKDEFMLRTVECSHAAIGLVPYTKVFQ